MHNTIGSLGAVGVILLVLGLGVVAMENYVVATGLALVIAGVGLLAYGMTTNFMKAMGLAPA